MSIFEKKFAILLEQPEPLAPPIPPGGEEVAAPVGEEPIGAPTVDTVDDVGDNPSIGWRKEANNKQRQQIQEWISRITDTTEFLNGVSSESMQAQLNHADCDTLFNQVSKSETKKISRIAQDLSALIESLKGYLLSSEDV